MQNFLLLGDCNVIGVRFLVGKMEIALYTVIICLFIFLFTNFAARPGTLTEQASLRSPKKCMFCALFFILFLLHYGENLFNSQERLLCLIVFLSFTVWRIQMFVTLEALRIQPLTGINFGFNCVNNRILESDWFSRAPLGCTTITY